MLGKLDRFKGWAPLFLRLVIGIIFISHGSDKVFGGMERFIESVAKMGMPPFLAYVSAGTELLGGILLVLGLLTRWAALFIVIDMAVAILKVHLPYGLRGAQGFEFPLMLLVGALALVLWGAGPLSLDRSVLKRKF